MDGCARSCRKAPPISPVFSPAICCRRSMPIRCATSSTTSFTPPRKSCCWASSATAARSTCWWPRAPDEEMGIRFGEEPAPFIRICANKCVFCFVKGLPERHHAAARPAAGHARVALHQRRRLPLQLPLRQLHHPDQPERDRTGGGWKSSASARSTSRCTPPTPSCGARWWTARARARSSTRSGGWAPSASPATHSSCSAPRSTTARSWSAASRDLAALRPIVESISVVPVGLTKYNNMLKVEELPPMRPYRAGRGAGRDGARRALAGALRRRAGRARAAVRLPLGRVVLRDEAQPSRPRATTAATPRSRTASA